PLSSLTSSALPRSYTLSLHDALPILFGYGEIISNLSRQGASSLHTARVNLGDLYPSKQEWKWMSPAIVRGSLIGTFLGVLPGGGDRKSTRLNSSHVKISYAVFCLKKK